MLRLKAAARQNGAAAPIDMTPMVDMVFLLLIFFLLTSMALTQPVLDLNLPRATQSESMAENEGLQIVIRKDGQIEIDHEAVPAREIERVLEKKLAAMPGKKVVLSADEKAPFGLFVQVLDSLQGLNHNNLAILTPTLTNESSTRKERP